MVYNEFVILYTHYEFWINDGHCNLVPFCWYIIMFWGHHLYQGHLVQQYFMLSFEIAVCLKHWIFCVIVIFASIPILLMTISPFTTWHVNKKCCISILYHIVRRHLVFLKNERIGKLVYIYVAGIIAMNIIYQPVELWLYSIFAY